MKNIVGILAAIVVLSSCKKVIGDGPVITETRNISNFTAIDLRMSADVTYTQGNSYKVEVSAQQNILNILQTMVSNNKLVIKFRNDTRVGSYDPVKITVTAPAISSLTISGSGNITGAGSLTPSSMDMNISGSGNITLTELHTGFVDATISGSGNIKILTGVGTEGKLNISGSGDIDLSDFALQKATTKISGSGNIKVNASQSLDVNISGSGSVYYKGTPVINTSISGSGKLIHL